MSSTNAPSSPDSCGDDDSSQPLGSSGDVDLGGGDALLLHLLQHPVNVILLAAEQRMDPLPVDHSGTSSQRQGEVEEEDDLHLCVEREEDVTKRIQQTFYSRK